MNKKWIQEAVPAESKGKLHKKLGIPEKKKIPEKTLEKAVHSKGILGKEARLAMTLKGLRQSSKRGK